jgi:hypothetical protein
MRTLREHSLSRLVFITVFGNAGTGWNNRKGLGGNRRQSSGKTERRCRLKKGTNTAAAFHSGCARGRCPSRYQIDGDKVLQRPKSKRLRATSSSTPRFVVAATR